MPGYLQMAREVCKATFFPPSLPPPYPSSFNLVSFLPFEIFEDLRYFHLFCQYLDLNFCVLVGGFVKDCNLLFKGVSDQDVWVYVCVLYSVICVVICDGHFALCGHHFVQSSEKVGLGKSLKIQFQNWFFLHIQLVKANLIK